MNCLEVLLAVIFLAYVQRVEDGEGGSRDYTWVKKKVLFQNSTLEVVSELDV